VLDTRLAGAVFGVIAVGLALSRVGRSRGLRRGVCVVALLLAVGAIGLLARDSFLAYRSEEVSFSSDVSLSGTLFVPRTGEPPFPAIVITHGAGESTRDEGSFFARMFARHGIAALAYDKRGSGESSGAVESATYEYVIPLEQRPARSVQDNTGATLLSDSGDASLMWSVKRLPAATSSRGKQ